MGQIYLGILYGYQYDTHGKYNIYLCYDSITRVKTKPSDIEISNVHVYAERYEQYKYTTNTLYIDSVSIGGVDFGISMNWPGHNGGDQATPSATSNSATKTITVGVDIASANVVVTGHRSGQDEGAQRFEGTVGFQSGHVGYTLRLDPTGGILPSAHELQLIYYSSNYYDISWNIPTKPGCIFNGWYTSPTNGVQVYTADGLCANEGIYWNNGSYVHAGDLTLYAQWKLAPAGMVYIKQDGRHTKGLVWKKHGGSWKRGIPWAKYKGSWKRG